MPPEGVEMTGNDPHHPEMHIDRRAFRDDTLNSKTIQNPKLFFRSDDRADVTAIKSAGKMPAVPKAKETAGPSGASA